MLASLPYIVNGGRSACLLLYHTSLMVDEVTFHNTELMILYIQFLDEH